MLTRTCGHAALRLGRAAASDQRGLAAIEFAFIAPLLILLFLGLTTLSSAIIAGRHTNHAASSVGDLVSQCANIDDADFTNIFAAGGDIMAPLSATTMQQLVTSVVVSDTNGDTNVQWSVPASGNTSLSPYSKGAAIVLPTGLVSNKGDTIVMSQVLYGFNFPGNWLNSGFNFNKTYYFKPRKSAQVTDTGSATYGGSNTTVSCYAS